MSAWLVEEGLEGLVATFTANNIDGTELLSLTKESLASELHIGEQDRCTHCHLAVGVCFQRRVCLPHVPWQPTLNTGFKLENLIPVLGHYPPDVL